MFVTACSLQARPGLRNRSTGCFALTIIAVAVDSLTVGKTGGLILRSLHLLLARDIVERAMRNVA